jgi:hypothetical protein
MAKVALQYEETVDGPPIGSSSHHESESTELRLQQSSPAEESTSDVHAFAQAHGLSHRLDLFQKAAAAIQGENIVDLTPAESDALHNETARKWQQPKMLYFTILVCSIGAIEQGWAQTGMNGANLYLSEAFGIGSDSKHDNFVVGLINSGIYLSTGLLWVYRIPGLHNGLFLQRRLAF